MNKIIPLVDINNTAYLQRKQFSVADVAEDHLFNYHTRSMTFDKDLGLKGKYCYHPFNTITVDGFGDVYMCICQAWLPVSVGKIWEFETFEDIVASAKAREIQASILDGTYKYCDDKSCSIIPNDLNNRISHKPDTINWINFSIDSSCNLTCPSCRSEFKFINEGPEYDRRIKIADHLIKLIQNHQHFIKFTLSGDGDPFASLVYRHFMSNLNLAKHQLVEIEIVTNGILAKSHWHKLKGIHNNIIRTKISFDAGCKNTYEKTRGGDWDKLLDSATALVKWKQKNYSSMKLTANFVVQTVNYKDMPQYVELCDKIGFDEINFQKIQDWGTYDNFSVHAVWQSTHPEYTEFLKVMAHPSLNNKKVNFTNLK